MEDYNKEDFEENVINIRRVAKVVKGGRIFRFTALVVIGNRKSLVGIGYGKAREMPEAVRKAVYDAFKNIIKINMKKQSITHDITYKFKASKILLKPATEGTGVIASGVVRSILELAGVQDILTKSFGSNNSINVAQATMRALKLLKV